MTQPYAGRTLRDWEDGRPRRVAPTVESVSPGNVPNLLILEGKAVIVS
jgi:hypothetical protein